MTATSVPNGFDRFWAIWPRNSGRYSRKGAKSACLAVWKKRYHESQADLICKHVAWLTHTADWLKDNGAYIPAPLVYLNQQRWDGADIPSPELSAADRMEVARQDATQKWLRDMEQQKLAAKSTDRSAIKAMLERARANVKGQV